MISLHSVKCGLFAAVAATLIAACGSDGSGSHGDGHRVDAGVGGVGDATSPDAGVGEAGPPEGGTLVCPGVGCPPGCGDGVCGTPDGNEVLGTCPTDCYCGNGTCDPGEASWTCPADCFCGNGKCESGEDRTSPSLFGTLCPVDCPCTDGVKNGTESDVDCGGSCEPCGNGLDCNVAADCGAGALCRSRCVPLGCLGELDAFPAAGSGTFALPVHVVVGPAPVASLAGAGVLAEGVSGDRVEAITDTAGDATLSLDAARGPWMLTVAKAGHAVSSIFPVDATFTGAVRLDPLALPPMPSVMFDVSGTTTGVSPIDVGGKQVLNVSVDAWEFGTTTPSPDGRWNSTYAGTDPTLPLLLFAMALSPEGMPVNFVGSADLVRDGTAKTAALEFPNPPAPVNDVTHDVTLPLDGLLDGHVVTPGTGWDGSVVDWTSVLESTSAIVGKGRLDTVSPGHLAWRIRSYSVDGATPDGTQMSIPIPAAQYLLNLYTDQFKQNSAMTVGRIECHTNFDSSWKGYQASAIAEGYDALIIHVGESPTSRPQMRVIVPFLGGKAMLPWLPHLPTGITLSSVGITPGSTTTSLAILASVRGPAWSTQILNAGIPEYRYTVAGAYANLTVDAGN